MKKIIISIVIIILFTSLTGCQSKNNGDQQSNGDQSEIFDSISEALKDIFD
jgi:hypothetical protein